MPNLNDVFKAIQNSVKNGSPDAVDVYRHKFLKKLTEHTGRNTIAYYSGFLSRPGLQLLGIND